MSKKPKVLRFRTNHKKISSKRKLIYRAKNQHSNLPIFGPKLAVKIQIHFITKLHFRTLVSILITVQSFILCNYRPPFFLPAKIEKNVVAQYLPFVYMNFATKALRLHVYLN